MYHWHDCTAFACTVTDNSQKDGYAAHVYDNDTDTDCNVCGYIRTVDGGIFFYPIIPTIPTTSTTTNPDGSTTIKTENKATGTATETIKNVDGSQIVVETRKDGTVTTTETDRFGNKTETVDKPDGSSVINVVQKDGTTAAITTNAFGQIDVSVTLPAAAVSEAQQEGGIITLPIPGVWNRGSATLVTIKTGSSKPVKVEIPRENATPGTVAVIDNADGTETVVKTTVSTGNSLVLPVSDGTTVKIVDNSRDFADVSPAHWAKDAVDFASARELFQGTTANTFDPEAPMTRAMLMTVLARYSGVDTSDGANWYEKGMNWAIANGISDGNNPNGNITREQLVTMLWRYAGSPPANGTLNGFTDTGDVSEYAQEAMRWAVEKGIVSGFGDGQLGPNNQATRAEVAAMIMRYNANA